MTGLGTTPLELLHPRGIVRRSIVIGAGCPSALCPSAGLRADDVSDCDLVVVAPSKREARSRRWRRGAARRAADAVATDGLVYLIAPCQGRGALRAALLAAGLRRGPSFLHVPTFAASGLVVPVERGAAAYALANLVALPKWKRRLALGIIGSLRLSVLERTIAHVGLVLQRPGASAPAAWLFDGPTGVVVVRLGWRRCLRRALVLGFARGHPNPGRVAKIAPDDTEASALRQFAPTAQVAGATVPIPLEIRELGASRAVVQTAVAGRPAALILGDDPKQLGPVLDRLTRWLDAWNRRTLRETKVGMNCLEREVLAPAAQLSPALRGGQAYVEWLERSCERAVGSRLPLVTTHNDLTMWNVLLIRDRLGIVDWYDARDAGLPLTDYCYALVDAVAASGGYADRVAAFERCFSHSNRVSSLAEAFPYLAGTDPVALELCFHACWVHHALNESRAEEPGSGGRPFLAIVQSLAADASRNR